MSLTRKCHIPKPLSGVSMFDAIGQFSRMSSLQGSNKLGIIPSPWPDTCGMKVGTCKPLAHVAGAKKCSLHPQKLFAQMDLGNSSTKYHGPNIFQFSLVRIEDPAPILNSTCPWRCPRLSTWHVPDALAPDHLARARPSSNPPKTGAIFYRGF